MKTLLTALICLPGLSALEPMSLVITALKRSLFLVVVLLFFLLEFS